MSATVEASTRRHEWRLFWRHFLEMFAVMAVGMFVAVFIFMLMVNLSAGSTTWEEALVRYPVHALLVVAFGMTAPMAAWMRHRGHAWRDSSEMAAAMALPVIPFLCLVWFGVTTEAQCGAYCGVSLIAMLGLMLYRRSVYAQHS